MASPTYKFHKYSRLYPLASEKELQDLAEDIKEHGLANPIILYNGQILDGRNRYIACQRANFSPDLEDFKNWYDIPTVQDGCYGTNEDKDGHNDDDHDALLWVIAQNSHRRHLSTSQLAMVAAQVAEVFKENAKQRRLAGQNNKAGAAVKAKLPGLGSVTKSTGQVRDEAAKAVGGVSGRSIQDASKILKASPELANKVSAGEMTVNQAKKELPKDSETPKAKNKTLPPLPMPEPIPEDIAVPKAKTLKVLDKIEKCIKEANTQLTYFTHYHPYCAEVLRKGTDIHSIKEYERLEKVLNDIRRIQEGLGSLRRCAPEKERIVAMIKIRDNQMCDSKWKIGETVSVSISGDDQKEIYKSLLAPFGWHKTMGQKFIKERTFADSAAETGGETGLDEAGAARSRQ